MEHYMQKLWNGLKAELFNLSVEDDEEGQANECNESHTEVGKTSFAKHGTCYRSLKKRADRYWNNPDFEKL